MEKLVERFLRYVKFDTQSDGRSKTCPSTEKQKILGAALVEEMLAMGIQDAHMDENGYVFGTVPGDPDMPSVGLISHLDTATNVSGANVKARIVEYQGGDILLNEELDIWLRPADYPVLDKHVGHHIIVTDGTTLLGGDNKAGIAEIMTTAEILMNSGEKHATLKIAFTPDEEIGRGAKLFPVEKFAADYAYTVDGGAVGSICYENFNADGADVVIKGRDCHPGGAKNKMVNSMLLAMEFQNALPVHAVPEATAGTEGFIGLMEMKGTVEKTTMEYIIRDHDAKKFQQKKDVMEAAATFLNAKYGEGTATVTFTTGYRNMRDKVEDRMYIVDRAVKAIESLGHEVKSTPVRGGTDGAKLSYMGLPCPNLGYGGSGAHSRYEFIPIENMIECTKILVALLKTE